MPQLFSRALLVGALALATQACIEDTAPRSEIDPGDGSVGDAGADSGRPDADLVDAQSRDVADIAPELDAAPRPDATAAESTMVWTAAMPVDGLINNFGAVRLSDDRTLAYGEFEGTLRFPELDKFIRSNDRVGYWVIAEPDGQVDEFGAVDGPYWTMVAAMPDGGWIAYRRDDGFGVLSRHGRAGAEQWRMRLDGPNTVVTAADSDGEDIVIAGAFTEDMVLNGPNGSVRRASEDEPLGRNDFFYSRGFIARLDMDGTPHDLLALRGTGSTAFNSLALNHGEIALCGGVAGFGGPRTVQFPDGSELTTNAPDDDPAGDPFLAIIGQRGFGFGGAWLFESYSNSLGLPCSHLDLPAGHHFGFNTRGGLFAPGTRAGTRSRAR